MRTAQLVRIHKRPPSAAAEAVDTLRRIWQQRQPASPLAFALWTHEESTHGVRFVWINWRDLSTRESGILARVRVTNYEHVAVAQALLEELQRLRAGAPPRKPPESAA
jgi:hypothetical protein